MKVTVLLMVTFALAAAGCAKKETPAEIARETAATLPPEEAARIEAQFLPATSAAAAGTIQERLNGAIHPGLTIRLKEFIDKHGRLPESIYEFANSAVDSMPPVPPGMKYVIDPADKTVKAVMK